MTRTMARKPAHIHQVPIVSMTFLHAAIPLAIEPVVQGRNGLDDRERQPAEQWEIRYDISRKWDC
jgi:hypothetical protein